MADQKTFDWKTTITVIFAVLIVYMIWDTYVYEDSLTRLAQGVDYSLDTAGRTAYNVVGPVIDASGKVIYKIVDTTGNAVYDVVSVTGGAVYDVAGATGNAAYDVASAAGDVAYNVGGTIGNVAYDVVDTAGNIVSGVASGTKRILLKGLNSAGNALVYTGEVIQVNDDGSGVYVKPNGKKEKLTREEIETFLGLGSFP